MHLGPEEGNEKSPRVPESVVKAALLRRAVEDIDRLIQIKSAKQACSSLLLRGSVGDDLWQRFQRAEKEMEEELRDVVTEVCFSWCYILTDILHALCDSRRKFADDEEQTGQRHGP